MKITDIELKDMTAEQLTEAAGWARDGAERGEDWEPDCWAVETEQNRRALLAAESRVYRYDEWAELMTAMMALKPGGARMEIDRETYDYYLGVLPPVYHGWRCFGFAEGAERVRRFTQEGPELLARYFVELTAQWNPHAL